MNDPSIHRTLKYFGAFLARESQVVSNTSLERIRRQIMAVPLHQDSDSLADLADHLTNCLTALIYQAEGNPETSLNVSKIDQTEEEDIVEGVELDKAGEEASLATFELDSDVVEIVVSSQKEETTEKEKFTIPLSDSSS
ncbi:hypothetical protein TCAL_04941 [Tigriopus californicus]|uniref:Uncharacterized protein n=1 Tax=Tigriopus californicus TaxID=6832 RepID=A0A553NC97_TIGCA|nr:uncharacterized protein LOC131887910 [Tigriopus californicus]TRY63074.1 hypothetical protein TCAL_04941 [Tigriopus californicus]|eukprot:TCALIF_04941-PA protein Name:"Protein of unknown function" AED:0.00 eAED:0.00 QI:47/1/1/1/1/1/2/78/138